MKKFSLLLAGLVLSVLTFASVLDNGFNAVFGPLFHPAPNVPPLVGPSQGLDSLHRWNLIAINATGLDHTPVAPGENRIFGEQFGPGRASRAMAIVHIAMFDALDAIIGGYASYTGTRPAPGPVSVDAAISQAAHDTLAAVFPSQTATFDAYLAQDLARVRNPQQKANGIDLGQRTAAAILAMRLNDGSQFPDPTVGVDYFPMDLPGHWRQDPVSLFPLAIGAHWGECIPFVVNSPTQFRAPPPPDMTSSAYTAAYIEVKNMGGDGIITPMQRTEEQTFIGTFWAYDATPSLCAPPRLYNQLTVQLADQRRLSAIQFARLLALVNTAMADTAMTVWESKYHYDLWRPIAGIRESDPGTGPTALGDGNPDTVCDPNFMPLGAPASNLIGPNFTPPFPAYPSGHAGFGGAVFQLMRRFYGTDNIAFTFVSDEFNGQTRDHDGNLRPYRPRSFSNFSQAEEENGQSRIYLGIHWTFDKTEGIALGRRVADYVFDRAFRPIRP
jgi:hypothetical protein